MFCILALRARAKASSNPVWYDFKLEKLETGLKASSNPVLYDFKLEKLETRLELFSTQTVVLSRF